jgi:hypothetical protein
MLLAAVRGEKAGVQPEMLSGFLVSFARIASALSRSTGSSLA